MGVLGGVFVDGDTPIFIFAMLDFCGGQGVVNGLVELGEMGYRGVGAQKLVLLNIHLYLF